MYFPTSAGPVEVLRDGDRRWGVVVDPFSREAHILAAPELGRVVARACSPWLFVAHDGHLSGFRFAPGARARIKSFGFHPNREPLASQVNLWKFCAAAADRDIPVTGGKMYVLKLTADAAYFDVAGFLLKWDLGARACFLDREQRHYPHAFGVDVLAVGGLPGKPYVSRLGEDDLWAHHKTGEPWKSGGSDYFVHTRAKRYKHGDLSDDDAVVSVVHPYLIRRHGGGFAVYYTGESPERVLELAVAEDGYLDEREDGVYLCDGRGAAEPVWLDCEERAAAEGATCAKKE